MKNKNITCNTKFGPLTISNGPENNYMWTGSINVSSKYFIGDIPIYIFTDDECLQIVTIQFVEKIIDNINYFLKDSIVFIRKTLNDNKEKYNIKENENVFLSYQIEKFPIDYPELIFYENSDEWMIRFAEGKFEICDPYGISIVYNLEEPIRVDNLEDSEEI